MTDDDNVPALPPGLSEDDLLHLVAEGTVQILQQAEEMTQQLHQQAEDYLGRPIVRQPRRVTVLDLTLSDLGPLLLQANHLIKLGELLAPYYRPGEYDTVQIGNRIKTLPPNVARQVTEHLSALGAMAD